MSKRLTQEEFIMKAIEKHGNEYDYSKVNYINGDSKIIIICPKHGEFLQRARAHVNDGQGCPECAKLQRKKTCKALYGYEIVACSEKSKEKAKETFHQKFGGNSPFSSKKIRDKAQKTVMERYGVEYITQNDEIKNKIVRTNMKRYGYPSSASNPEVRRKQKETLIQNYGVDNSMKSPLVRDKAKATMLERYGVDNPQKSDIISAKTKETCIERYGVPYVVQSDKIRQKIIETMISQYGVDNPMKCNEIKQKARKTCIDKYGVINPMQCEEIKQKAKNTMIERYGAEYPLQNKHIMQKLISSKRTNNTFNTSNPEEKLNEILINMFGSSDIIRQYSSVEYPFRCDFYIKSKNLYVELNCFVSHGKHWFNNESDSDIKKVEELTIKAQKSNFYKNILYTWTHSDVIKRNTAKENNLNYAVFWNDDLSDAIKWITDGCQNKHDWL